MVSCGGVLSVAQRIWAQPWLGGLQRDLWQWRHALLTFFFVRRRPQKWAEPARACHWMQCTLSSLLFNLYSSVRALRMLDTCWLKPELYDLKLPMDTLDALSMLCMSNIVIE